MRAFKKIFLKPERNINLLLELKCFRYIIFILKRKRENRDILLL